MHTVTRADFEAAAGFLALLPIRTPLCDPKTDEEASPPEPDPNGSLQWGLNTVVGAVNAEGFDVCATYGKAFLAHFAAAAQQLDAHPAAMERMKPALQAKLWALGEASAVAARCRRRLEASKAA